MQAICMFATSQLLIFCWMQRDPKIFGLTVSCTVFIFLAIAKFMNAKLKFNFFDLKTSHILNQDIPELHDHSETVKSTALDHASYFWASYLQDNYDEVLMLKYSPLLRSF